MISKNFGFPRTFDGNSRILVFLPAVFAILAFVNILSNEFVYDDFPQIVRSRPTLQDWSLENLGRAFTLDVWSFLTRGFETEDQTRSSFYRPFFVISKMAVSLIAGLAPWKWHLVSLAWHAAAGCLAYQTLLAGFRLHQNRIERSEAIWMACFGALFFTVHPVQCESVAWVSGDVNPISTVFVFGSILWYFKAQAAETKFEVRKATGWSLGFFACCLLTKESTVIVPLLILGYEFSSLGTEPGRKKLFRVLPYFVVLAGYFILRGLVLGTVLNAHPESSGLHWSVSIFTAPKILAIYLQHSLFPFRLGPIYPLSHVTSAGDPEFAATAGGLAILGAAALWAAKRNPVVRLGLMWFLVPLLPALNVRFFKPEQEIQDRYLYLSMVGLGLLTAVGLKALNKVFIRMNDSNQSEPSEHPETRLPMRTSVGAIAATILVVLTLASIKQNTIWKNEATFWGAAWELSPDSCQVNGELGRLFEAANQYPKAVEHYERAWKNCPNHYNAPFRLGGIRLQTKDYGLSEKAFLKSLELNPPVNVAAAAFFNLGFIAETRGESENALAYYETGLKVYPQSKFAPRILQAVEKLKAEKQRPRP